MLRNLQIRDLAIIDAVEIDFTSLSEEHQRCRRHCQCGCAEVDAMQIVGWCVWCTHVYSEYNRTIETQHFAYHCPGAPDELKRNSLALLSKRRAS